MPSVANFWATDRGCLPTDHLCARAVPPAGADDVPAFLQEPQYADMFISPTRLITRQPGEWYAAPAQRGAAASPAAAVV